MRSLLLSLLCLTFIYAQGQDKIGEINVKSLDGRSVSFNDVIQDDKLTVISFWATWCAPCKKELDAIAEIYEDWQAEYDMELIAVSVDDARASAKVKPMVAEKGWPYRVYVDINQSFMRSLHFQTVPYTILLDKAGKIIYRHSGYLPGDELELEEKMDSL